MIDSCVHDWQEGYYGTECSICGLFYPDGGTLWINPDEDEHDECDDTTMYRTCPSCGGEFWDGGSSCTCLFDELDQVVIQFGERELEFLEGRGKSRLEVCTLLGLPVYMFEPGEPKAK